MFAPPLHFIVMQVTMTAFYYLICFVWHGANCAVKLKLSSITYNKLPSICLHIGHSLVQYYPLYIINSNICSYYRNSLAERYIFSEVNKHILLHVLIFHLYQSTLAVFSFFGICDLPLFMVFIFLIVPFLSDRLGSD